MVFSLGNTDRVTSADPPGKNSGGYELKMAFKYVSESQQEPVTIKSDDADRMEFPFNATEMGGRQCQVSWLCLLFVYDK